MMARSGYRGQKKRTRLTLVIVLDGRTPKSAKLTRYYLSRGAVAVVDDGSGEDGGAASAGRNVEDDLH